VTRVAVVVLLCVTALAQDAEKEAGRLFAQGQRHYKARRYAEAIELFEKARAQLEEIEDETAIAWTYSWVANAYKRLGRPEKELPAREECLERMRAVTGPGDAPNIEVALNKLGKCLMGLGRPEDALSRLEESLAMSRRIHPGDHGATAHNLTDVGTCLEALSRFDAAEQYLSDALAMRRRLYKGDHKTIAVSLASLARLDVARGRLMAALPRYEQVLAMRGRIYKRDHPSVVVAHLGLAICLGDLGRASEAHEHNRLALAMARRMFRGDHTLLARAQNDLAISLDELGRPAEALPHLEAVVAMRRRIFDGDHPDLVRNLVNLGTILRSLGRHEEALTSLEEARAMSHRLFPDPNMLHVRTAEALGGCLLDLRRYRASRIAHEAALETLQQILPGDNLEIAIALSYIGGSLATEDPAAALVYGKRSLEMIRRLFEGDHPQLCVAAGNVGRRLLRLGRTDEGIHHLRLAAEMGERLSLPFRFQWEATLGRVYTFTLNDPTRAVPFLESAIAQVEVLRRQATSLEERDRALYFKELKRTRPFSTMVVAQHRLGRPDQALAYLERARARTAAELLERSRFDPLAAAQDDKIAAVSVTLARTSAEVGRLAHATTRTQNRKQLKALFAKLGEARAAHHDALRKRARLVHDLVPIAAPATPADLQAMLGPDERMLVYFMHERLLILVVTSKAIEVVEVDVAPGDIAGSIDTFLEALRSKQPADGEDLAEALVPEAVWQEIKGARRVYVIPDGPLHWLPFEALPVKGGTWLEKGPPLAYASSGSVLAWCKQQNQPRQKKYAAVVLGDPQFASLPALPGTRAEVDAIKMALGNVATLTGKDATGSRLHELAPQGRFLHLATHHRVDEKDWASDSRLALTGGSLRLLDLFEHWRGRLDGCELVVLSGCETSRGHLQRDEGVFAMPLGFLYAGAPAVIASLWRVDDTSTAELMGDFYKRLKAGDKTLEAFTQARRALRKKHPHPYHWAAFVLIGHPG